MIQLQSGGVVGGRPIDTENIFEVTLWRLFSVEARTNENLCVDLWSALTNNVWSNADMEISYSYRAAGDLVAAIRGYGDYMDWYCQGLSGLVLPDLVETMKNEGWSHRPIVTGAVQ